jgi:DNA-binding PadR family transcriptional regulator
MYSHHSRNSPHRDGHQHRHDFSHHGDSHSHSHWHLGGRQHGGHGDGHHHGGFGRDGFGRDGDGLPRARKFSSEDLQLMLLALLADKPSHGYELIKALETRSNGFYTPSPGMIYPALTYLEELGFVSVTQEGNRKAYELTELGKAYLATNQERADLMLAKLSHIARKMDSIRRAYSGEPYDENDANASGWIPEFVDARRALKATLVKLSEVGAAEQKRIAAILNEATRKILGE